MPVSRSISRRGPRALIAGVALALGLTLVGASGQAKASENPDPTCWGPANSPADCPDYSLMNPYAYGKYRYRQPYPYGYGYGGDREAPPYSGYGRPSPYGR
jgi:hypothetical protein